MPSSHAYLSVCLMKYLSIISPFLRSPSRYSGKRRIFYRGQAHDDRENRLRQSRPASRVADCGICRLLNFDYKASRQQLNIASPSQTPTRLSESSLPLRHFLSKSSFQRLRVTLLSKPRQMIRLFYSSTACFLQTELYSPATVSHITAKNGRTGRL